MEQLNRQVIRGSPGNAFQASLPRYRLASHLRACITHGSTVMLDLRTNRYLGLGPRETNALQMILEDWNHRRPTLACRQEMPMRDALEVIQHLVDRGLVKCSSAFVDTRVPPLASPTRAILLAHHSAPLSAHAVLRFAQACLWARFAIRSQSLEVIARSVAAHRTGPGDPHYGIDEVALVQRVQQFHQLRLYSLTTLNECLFHALALTRFLAAFRLFPTWVIGVRTKSWGAHSWVQHADLVLDDTPEHVLEYTPLLIV